MIGQTEDVQHFALDRKLFHSFPRPKKNESKSATYRRGLKILRQLKEVGLVLAPEVVSWDIRAISGSPTEELKILQRRACFTELDISSLADHSAVFGPISLGLNIAKLRNFGAMPVIYIPQGVANSYMSYLATFCARGVYHTRGVLAYLNSVREIVDPEIAQKRFGAPISPEFKLTLQNPDKDGKIAQQFEVPGESIRAFLSHALFNNIPFEHSVAVLDVFLNILYPTDNLHSNDSLGYYRQREWRIFGTEVLISGQPMTRTLSSEEAKKTIEIDPDFWTRILDTPEGKSERIALARVYQPSGKSVDFFDAIDVIYAPKSIHKQIVDLVGPDVALQNIE